MAPVIVYGLSYSNPTRAVLLTAKLLGLEVDYREVNIFEREQFAPEYLKLNPQHTIPTIDDNGNALWDSHAILTYLIDKYAKDDSLYSKDLYTRAKINQRLFFEAGILFPAVRYNLAPVFFRGQDDFTDAAREEIVNAYSLLETFFTDNLYLIGNTLTVADLSSAPSVSQLEIIVPVDGAKYPKIRAWLDRVASKLPNYYEINTKPLEDLKKNIPVYIAKGKEKLRKAKEASKN